MGNEVPGRALACQGYPAAGLLKARACLEAHVGSPRDFFHSQSTRSLLSFSVGGAVGNGFNLTEV